MAGYLKFELYHNGKLFNSTMNENRHNLYKYLLDKTDKIYQENKIRIDFKNKTKTK